MRFDAERDNSWQRRVHLDDIVYIYIYIYMYHTSRVDVECRWVHVALHIPGKSNRQRGEKKREKQYHFLVFD